MPKTEQDAAKDVGTQDKASPLAAVAVETDTAEACATETDVIEKIEPAVMMVEIAYALPEKQVIIPLAVEPDTTLEQAVLASGILDQFPDIDLTVNKVGIFGKLSKRDAVLREKDRVEIYRKLIADPKKVRKERAAQGKVMKKGSSE